MDHVHCNQDQYIRDARQVGDPRKLPFIKDVFNRGLAAVKGKSDVIIWTNDDVGLDTGIIDWCYNVESDGAASMRRNESGHVGRDLFGFTKKWLEDNLAAIPDFIHGAPCWDLVLAAIIRKNHGIKSDLTNLGVDIWPAETPDRYALHESHPSAWAGSNENKYPANLWNQRLARAWTAKYMPSLKL